MPDDPTDGQLKILRTIARFEKDGGPMEPINQQDAEECVDRGWLDTFGVGGYRLTPEGRAVLRQHSGTA